MTEKIRNFSIIAHIDHGKSTLADRMLEITGTRSMREMTDRVLDTLELEQERGITIKLQTVRMNWKYSGKKADYTGKDFILNIIDTPGHVDFSYEVSRSLAACEGAILLIDATQGIQAQTISTIFQAWEHNLQIIPVLNKIDLPNAEVERRKEELIDYLGFKEEEIMLASGKTGEGVEDLLNRVVEIVHAPKDSAKEPTQALIFDSFFDEHKGIVVLVKMQSGEIKNLKQGEKLFMLQKKGSFSPIEIGYLKPQLHESGQILTGEVGYIATGIKEIKQVSVGDTVSTKPDTTPLPGYKKMKPMVYASMFPVESDEFEKFREALERLALNDSSIDYQLENSKALGFGFRCGFLGLLHMEIAQERLSREFGTEIILTTPTVEYELIRNGELEKIHSASDFPEITGDMEVKEPWVEVEIVSPDTYMGGIMQAVHERRGIYKDTKYISTKTGMSKRIILTYEMPLAEIVTNFFNKLKSISQGYASMDYRPIDYRKAEVVKVDVLVNKEVVEPLSFLVHESYAREASMSTLEILKDAIPRHQFKIALQATIGAKIIAREDIGAVKKDVTAKLYGGDVTRKKKLLEKQKKGKKKLKEIGGVSIPQEAFLSVLKR